LNHDPPAQPGGSGAFFAIRQKRVLYHQDTCRHHWMRGKNSLVHVERRAHGAVSNSARANPPAALDRGEHELLQTSLEGTVDAAMSSLSSRGRSLHENQGSSQAKVG
jgi:hypothetical protein